MEFVVASFDWGCIPDANNFLNALASACTVNVCMQWENGMQGSDC